MSENRRLMSEVRKQKLRRWDGEKVRLLKWEIGMRKSENRKVPAA
jgi:hypothetical protein